MGGLGWYTNPWYYGVCLQNGEKSKDQSRKKDSTELATPKLMYVSTMIVLLAGMAALLAFTHLGPGDYSVDTSASGSERSGTIN